MFEQASGIRLPDSKRALIEARLRTRLQALGLEDFDAYCKLLKHDPGPERRTAIDLLTTNETYFYREPSHFQLLRRLLNERYAGRAVRIWSAACSSGEEAYSLAMTLLDVRPKGDWQISASDLSGRMLEKARAGLYPMQRLEHLPPAYLKRFAQRGTGPHEGQLRLRDNVRASVDFFQHNLLHPAPALGTVHVLFLRNVLIYFDPPAKQAILARLVQLLPDAGTLFVGHSETLQGMGLQLRLIAPGCYEKLGAVPG